MSQIKTSKNNNLRDFQGSSLARFLQIYSTMTEQRWDIENEGFDYQSWGLFLVAAVIGWMILGLALEPGEPQGESVTMSSVTAPNKKASPPENENRLIDRHLAHTQNKLELSNVQASIHNLKTPNIDMDSLGPLERSPAPQHRPGVDIVEQSTSEEVMRDIQGLDLGGEADPADRIQMMIAKKKWMTRYDREYRRGLVKEVKAKARAEGFLIEFDEDLNVMSVKEIEERQPMLFEADD